MASLRNRIEDIIGAAYPPERDRYYLYVSLSCPFACNVLAAINLKGLCEFVTVVVVHPVLQRTRPNDPRDQHNGWMFVDPTTTPSVRGPTGRGSYSTAGCTPDPLYGATFLRDLYERVTRARVRFNVPLLWDAKTQSVVSNQSSDLVRMFNTAFEDIVPSKIDLYPPHLQQEIDDLTVLIEKRIMCGAYHCGFAQDQESYEAALDSVFCALDALEDILSRTRYLTGNDQLTEADLKLFAVLVRFDEVYAVHYKLNKKRVRDYPNLFNYVKDLYQIPEIGSTVNMDHIKMAVYGSQLHLNPFGIVPAGPATDFSAPHDRRRFY